MVDVMDFERISLIVAELALVKVSQLVVSMVRLIAEKKDTEMDVRKELLSVSQ
jgi:hypothetical protein